MAKKQKSTPAPADTVLKNVSDYRFPEATRKNNPPAKIAAEGYVPLIPKAEYLYSPRRPPELRFDPTGGADELPELLAAARQRKLTEAEACVLAEALRAHEPWQKAGDQVVRRGSGCAAYPRAGKRAGHSEGGCARGCEPVAEGGRLIHIDPRVSCGSGCSGRACDPTPQPPPDAESALSVLYLRVAARDRKRRAECVVTRER